MTNKGVPILAVLLFLKIEYKTNSIIFRVHSSVWSANKINKGWKNFWIFLAYNAQTA